MFLRICLHTNFLFGFFPKNLFVFFLFCFVFYREHDWIFLLVMIIMTINGHHMMRPEFCIFYLLWNMVLWYMRCWFVQYSTFFSWPCKPFFQVPEKLFHHTCRSRRNIHSIKSIQNMKTKSSILHVDPSKAIQSTI